MHVHLVYFAAGAITMPQQGVFMCLDVPFRVLLIADHWECPACLCKRTSGRPRSHAQYAHTAHHVAAL